MLYKQTSPTTTTAITTSLCRLHKRLSWYNRWKLISAHFLQVDNALFISLFMNKLDDNCVVYQRYCQFHCAVLISDFIIRKLDNIIGRISILGTSGLIRVIRYNGYRVYVYRTISNAEIVGTMMPKMTKKVFTVFKTKCAIHVCCNIYADLPNHQHWLINAAWIIYSEYSHYWRSWFVYSSLSLIYQNVHAELGNFIISNSKSFRFTVYVCMLTTCLHIYLRTTLSISSIKT